MTAQSAPSLTQAPPQRALDGLATRWRYSGGKRDLRLDLLRGFAAFAMIVDHVGGESSWLYPITGGNRFFVSAAEAFVLISGIVLGIVYRDVVASRGVAAALMKALHRAWMLYVATVALSLSFAALGAALDLSWAPVLGDGGVVGFALEIATLHRTVYLVDILLLYTLLLLIAAPAILLLSQGQTAVVLAISWLAWTLWQVAPQASSFVWDVQGNDVFKITPWQVIFVTGIAAGWHRAAIARWLKRVPPVYTRTAVVSASIAVLALYVVQLTSIAQLEANPLLGAFVFDKPNLVIGRLVVLALLAVVAYGLVTVLWDPISRATGWLLLPLGQQALLAYSVHIFVVAAVAAFAAGLPEGTANQTVVATALQLAAVAIVWVAVRSEPALRNELQQLMPRSLGSRLLAAVSLRDDTADQRA